MTNNRYSNAKIYRLVNNVDGEVYVGSTCDALHKRLYQHKLKAKADPHRNVYKHLNQIGWENVSIVLVEQFPCSSKMELLKRERYFIEELKASLNKVIPTRTKQEYNEHRKDFFAEYMKEYQEKNKELMVVKRKEWYEKNKQVILEKNKKRYEQNKEVLAKKQREYIEKNKEVIAEKKKQYQEKNKEAIKLYKKQYREKNREAINAKQREMYALKRQQQLS